MAHKILPNNAPKDEIAKNEFLIYFSIFEDITPPKIVPKIPAVTEIAPF